ncbi:hypothetical protein KFU94_43090 [Chloroflexi bacterium TSY]|nr:hypothetical protein [Chloroflexi bacterium TSY]
MLQGPSDNQVRPDIVKWRHRFFRRLAKRSKGDVIAANISPDVQGVAVGKNIFQIGKLTIPRWLLAVVIIGLIMMLLVAAYIATRTSRGFVTTQEKLEEAQTERMEIQEQIGTVAERVVAPSTPTQTPLPPQMESSNFNIAVVPFNALDKDGQPIDNEIAVTQAQRIAGWLQQKTVSLSQIIRIPVEVWGPDRIGASNQVDSVAIWAESLNTDVLVYGNLRRISDKIWQLEPSFYLGNKHPAMDQGAELLRGEYGLGAPISYQPGNLASEGDLNEVQQTRIDALINILRGLSYLSNSDYEKAIQVFRDIAEHSTWAQAEDRSGQEVLYHFLGVAYVKNAPILENQLDSFSAEEIKIRK